MAGIGRRYRCGVRVGAAVVAAMLFVGTANADDVGGGDPPLSGMRQHAVPLDKFAQLRAGIKKTEVEQLLGKSGEHQFTYMDKDGHVWQCEQYAVAQEPRYASSGFNLLYKDDALYALVDYMDAWKALWEAKPGQLEDGEQREERIQPVAFDDDTRIRELFRVKSLRGEDIAKSMPELKKRILKEERQTKVREKRNPPDPGLTTVVTFFDLLNPSVRAEMKRAYKTNAEFINKFDGGKVAIGMTEAQVNHLFGEPLLRENLNDGQHVAIYGPKDTTAIAMVQEYLACSPVMVLYRDSAVVRMLSNWYFAADWRDKVWPELKSPER